jgi:hypothetical protein
LRNLKLGFYFIYLSTDEPISISTFVRGNVSVVEFIVSYWLLEKNLTVSLFTGQTMAKAL